MKTLTLSKLAAVAALALPALFTASNANAAEGWEKSDSVYEVPVPEELKDVAVFEIQNVQTRTRNGVEEIKYNLPLELTGVPNRIRLKSNADGTYSGPNVSGTCANDVCNLKYKDLKFDVSAVQNLFEARGITGIEFDRRMQVFGHFSGDPGGIIRRKPSKKY